MSKGQWYTIAEIYRNREHAVLQFIQSALGNWQDGKHTPEQTLKLISGFCATHLRQTGRSSESPLEIKELSDPDDDARAKLLALLAPSQEELAAHIPPAPKLTKNGKPRKQRTDKGKKRGKRKVKE